MPLPLAPGPSQVTAYLPSDDRARVWPDTDGWLELKTWPAEATPVMSVGWTWRGVAESISRSPRDSSSSRVERGRLAARVRVEVPNSLRKNFIMGIYPGPEESSEGSSARPTSGLPDPSGIGWSTGRATRHIRRIFSRQMWFRDA